MLLACVQTDVRFADVAANVHHVTGLIEQLGKDGVDFAVFPECMLTGYCFESRQEALPVALAPDDPAIAEIAAATGQAKLTLTLGTLLRDGDRLTNSALLIDGGRVIAQYDKIHLPRLGVDRFVDRGEANYQAHGTSLESGCRVGMAICYDSSFPEPMRAIGLAGADVIALGTNWPVAASRTAEIVPPARSMENHLYFVSANRVGIERDFHFCGLSAICGPDGVEMARAGAAEETILKVEIDPTLARNKWIERTPGKHAIDRFADRQPHTYGRLIEPVA